MDQGTRAKTISFMSAKGGVGKTSIAVNVANFCAHYKMKVLLVDCDLRTRGATHFLKISTISLEDESFITLDQIIGHILNQKIKEGRQNKGDESNKGDENNEGDENNKDKGNTELSEGTERRRPISIDKSFEFIPASLQSFDCTYTLLYDILNDNIKKESNDNSKKESNDNSKKESNDNSKSDSDQVSHDEFENKLRNEFQTYQQEYELILLDLGAGNDILNQSLNRMSDCICLVAEYNKVSSMSVRDLTVCSKKSPTSKVAR